MGRVCRDFAIFYVLAVFALIVLGALIQILLGRDIGSVANVLPAFVAAFYTGHRYGTRHGTTPESGFAWKAAFWMLLICLLYSAIMVMVFALALGVGIVSALMSAVVDLPASWLIGIVAVVLALYLIIPRFAFSWGARMAVKAEQKRLHDTF